MANTINVSFILLGLKLEEKEIGIKRIVKDIYQTDRVAAKSELNDTNGWLVLDRDELVQK